VVAALFHAEGQADGRTDRERDMANFYVMHFRCVHNTVRELCYTVTHNSGYIVFLKSALITSQVTCFGSYTEPCSGLY
jgi:hypothetical protein